MIYRLKLKFWAAILFFAPGKMRQANASMERERERLHRRAP